jgi:hypothetical protein
MGRPSAYDPDKNILVEGWARDGLTNEQIAHNLGITVKTLYEWQNKYSEFRNALKNGKEVVDRLVENALFKRAMGYDYEEVTREPLYHPITGEPILDKKGKPKVVVTKVIRKQVNPDTTAQIFWLKNRKPGEWRDKQDIEHSGGVNIKLEGEVKSWAK